MSSGTVRLRFKMLVLITVISFIFYLFWNLLWLSQGNIPPSILVGVFKIPAPTTAMTRSTVALLNGDILASLKLNPFTIPTILLYLRSLHLLFKKVVKKENVNLSPTLIKLWITVMALAWIYKISERFLVN